MSVKYTCAFCKEARDKVNAAHECKEKAAYLQKLAAIPNPMPAPAKGPS